MSWFGYIFYKPHTLGKIILRLYPILEHKNVKRETSNQKVEAKKNKKKNKLNKIKRRTSTEKTTTKRKKKYNPKDLGIQGVVK